MTAELFIRLIADVAIIPIILISAYALIFKIPKGQRYEAYCRILMAGLTAYLIAKLLSSVYQPSLERPFEVLGVDPGASYLNNPGFPSDHMLLVSSLVAAVWFETRQKTITIILVILAACVGVGRVLALVHTPFDIIGGMVIAAIGALWYLNKPSGQKANNLNGKNRP